MSNKRTVYTNISKLYTLSGGKRLNQNLEDVKILKQAWMVIEDETIIAVGENECPYLEEDVEIIDLLQQIVIPGLIDSHTHLVFGGSRSNEYPMKMAGARYLDILNAGGGIFSTVKATRLASFDSLYAKAKDNLDYMLSCGVTTLEAKSGYGLDFDTELKQLRVVQSLKKDTPIEFVSTFMPAHALPKEFDCAHDYFEYTKNEVLPTVMKEELAEYMDCFLEKDVFNADEAKEILSYGKAAGLKIKIHVDEIASIGGIPLACELGARSVEHCMCTSDEDMERLAKNQIATILLPVTSFNLGSEYARAKEMIKRGVLVAIASDFNPGSCPCNDMIWTMRIASRGYKLTPNQILSMATINAAYALDRSDRIGSLEVNKQADFVVMNVESFDEVVASMRQNPITAVYKKGRKVL